MPIIFVNDDIPNTLNGREEEQLSHEQIIPEQRREETNINADLNESLERIEKEANGTEGVKAIEFTSVELKTIERKEFKTIEQAEWAPEASVDNELTKLPKKNENCDKEYIEIDTTDIKRQVTNAETKKEALTKSDNKTPNIEGASQFKQPKVRILQNVSLNAIDTCLFYPSPISTSRKRKEVDPQPSAISSPKYREYLRNKATKKNSTERQGKQQIKVKRTNNKNNSAKTSTKVDGSNVTKTKENCWNCKEDLDSDVDEGDLEHVGCDNCPRWFHLKCSTLTNRSVLDLKDEYFKCNFC